MNRKVLSLLIVAVMVLSVVPLIQPVSATTSSAMPGVSQTVQEPKTLKELNPKVAEYIDLLKAKFESSKEPV
ncbi:hypothetical protein [Thermococcus peptonophilus]|uniref:hypothetical protein n=1 Tax=Thermococcus peptonophilus TaxID=53952 RepID=UPI0006D0A868